MTTCDADPLSRFLHQLGCDHSPAAEDADRLDIEVDVSVEDVRKLDFAYAADLIEAYAGAVEAAEIKRHGMWSIRIETGLTREQFEQERDTLTDGTYQLDLSIDKRKLVELTLGPDRARSTVLWFFADSLVRVLRQGIDTFAALTWGERTGEGRLVLVGDTELGNAGPMLRIAGSGRPDHAALRAPVPDPVLSEDIQRFRTSRLDYVRWDDVRVGDLTPRHLRLNGEPGATELESLLTWASVRLCLLYTCDFARRLDGARVRVDYGGDQDRVSIVLPDEQRAGSEVARGCAELAEWCYHRYADGSRDVVADRLEFARAELAHRLGPMSTDDRLPTLLRTIGELATSLDAQWRIFMTKEITTYLDNQRTLEELLHEVARAFAERTTALTKSLGDAMLGAVAVLVGSAIAAAFKTPFDATLFRVGVLAYAVYLIVFPGCYGIGVRSDEFKAMERALDRDRRRFGALLGDSVVAGMVQEVEPARWRYHVWRRRVITGFALAVAAAVALAVVVPMIVP